MYDKQSYNSNPGAPHVGVTQQAQNDFDRRSRSM